MKITKPKKTVVRFLCHLRQKREEKGLNQRQVSAAVGVSHGMIPQWERSRCSPSIHVAYRFAKFFGCAVQDIWPTIEPCNV